VRQEETEMKRCEEYEVELSAMLDGESDPATAVGLIDHVCQCSSCRDFYRELRSFQAIVDDISPVESAQPDIDAVPERLYSEPRRRRFGWLGATPRWVWATAAVAIVAVGLWAVGTGVVTDEAGVEMSGGSVTIELEGNKMSVDDERFIQLASEILAADKRYQHQLYVILDQVRQVEQPGEAPFDGELAEGERGGEYSGESFAHIGGRRVLD
jgi:predicted anti-sigma-YlaC factor YlaD